MDNSNAENQEITKANPQSQIINYDNSHKKQTHWWTNMKDKKRFLKSKDLLIKIISISGMIYGVCVLLLVIFVIAFSQLRWNNDLKNIVILLGFLSLMDYLLQLGVALYLAISYHILLKEIQLTKKLEIEKWCWSNVAVIGCLVGYACFPFLIKIKLTTFDLVDTYLPSKLNAFVKLDLKYDITNQKSLSDFVTHECNDLGTVVDNVQSNDE